MEERLTGSRLNDRLNDLPPGNRRDEKRRLIMVMWDVMERFGCQETVQVAQDLMKEKELFNAKRYLLEGNG